METRAQSSASEASTSRAFARANSDRDRAPIMRAPSAHSPRSVASDPLRPITSLRSLTALRNSTPSRMRLRTRQLLPSRCGSQSAKRSAPGALRSAWPQIQYAAPRCASRPAARKQWRSANWNTRSANHPASSRVSLRMTLTQSLQTFSLAPPCFLGGASSPVQVRLGCALGGIRGGQGTVPSQKDSQAFAGFLHEVSASGRRFVSLPKWEIANHCS